VWGRAGWVGTGKKKKRYRKVPGKKKELSSGESAKRLIIHKGERRRNKNSEAVRPDWERREGGGKGGKGEKKGEEKREIRWEGRSS